MDAEPGQAIHDPRATLLPTNLSLPRQGREGNLSPVLSQPCKELSTDPHVAHAWCSSQTFQRNPQRLCDNLHIRHIFCAQDTSSSRPYLTFLTSGGLSTLSYPGKEGAPASGSTTILEPGCSGPPSFTTEPGRPPVPPVPSSKGAQGLWSHAVTPPGAAGVTATATIPALLLQHQAPLGRPLHPGQVPSPHL